MPSSTPDDPVIRALDFLEKYRDLYLLWDPRSQLFLDHIVRNELGQHVFFGQRRDEVPVFAAEIAVHLSKDAIIGTNGNYLTEIPAFPPPVISEKRAETIALEYVGDENAQRVGEPKLVYFNARLFMTPADISNRNLGADTHQAWQLTLQGDANITGIYFIDAQTGAVLFRLDVSPTHAPSKDLSIRTANNTTGFLCTFGGAANWFDENGLLPGASPDAEASNAFNFANQVYDFYYNNFHRHSWNNNGGELSMILDDGRTTPNASFDGLCKHFIFSNNFATLDVLAHEFTHGVTDSAGSGNLLNADQPGALNESYSDVFAALIDTANFTIGEGVPGGPLRSISNPPAFGDPDVMSNFV